MGKQLLEGNRRALRHGLRSSRLPRGCSYIARCLGQFRRCVEEAVIDQRGELGLADAAMVSTAVMWQRHVMLCCRWLAIESDSMTIDQRIACSRDVGRASDSRDRAIRALGLEPGREPDIWQAIHSPPQQLPSPAEEP